MKIIQGTFLPLNLDPLWCSWFVGFVEGEGYFQIQIKNPSVHLVIEQREDNKNILQEIHKKLNCGNIYYLDMQYDRDKTGHLSSNKYRWTIGKIDSIVGVIIPLFDAYPLKSKKLQEYLLWRDIAWMIWKSKLGINQKLKIEKINDHLKDLRIGPYERSVKI